MPDFSSSIDLETLDGLTGGALVGSASGGFAGYSVASLGDINGDGIDDVIVGAPGTDDGSDIDVGISYVVYGQVGGVGKIVDLSNLSPSDGFQILGAAEPTESGSSVAGIGDVNDDGIDDFAITAPVADSGSGHAGGYTYVIYGNASGFGSGFDLSQPGQGDAIRLFDQALDDVSALSVSAAGDVNGDNIDDFIIGAAGVDVDSKTDNGVSYVVFGNAGGFTYDFNLASLNGTNGFRLDGGPDEASGTSVASAGDIDGDGYDDLIIGAPNADPGGNSEGSAYVVFGGTGFSADMNLADLNGTTGFRIDGVGSNDLAGMSVSSAGDFDGDGYDDIIIGAPGSEAGGATTTGAAYILFGDGGGFSATIDLSTLAAGDGLRLDGVAANDLAGLSVASIGDLNGDGFDDVLIGASQADPNGPGNEGAAYVVFGSAGYGATASIDLLTLNGTNGFRLDGVTAGALTGGSVSSAGDLNNDGYDDLLVGASFLDGGDGGAYVVYGRAPTTAVNRTGSNADQVIRGGDFGDTLSGLNGNDSLLGEGGNDSLNGGNGDDTLIGGANNDTLDGSYGHDSLEGGTGNDSLYGGDGSTGNDTLDGGSGNDTLVGRGGVDLLRGGSGNDFYEADTNDTVVELAGGGTDTVLSYAYSMTLADNVEYMEFADSGSVLSGTGNALDNQITGNQYGNTLDGAGGADTMIGGDGDDVYVVDTVGDVVTEDAAEGSDTVQASIDYALGGNLEGLELTGSADLTGMGNASDNTIIGNAGNNTLDGGAGADTMTGGDGDDLYVVDNAGDVVAENTGEGNDTVQASVSYTLTNYVEDLELTGTGDIDGTGNNDANTITGNSGANTLDGKAGDDTLIGGAGDDTYIINSGSNTIVEAANGGTDTVLTSGSHTLAANVENLTLTLAGHDRILTGNTLDNQITGASARDIIDGGAGADTMIGGADNDTYTVDDAGDVVTENAAEGDDTVNASVTHTLAANVEKLVLTGTAAIDGTGNGEANDITGNSAANTLSGAGGDDTIHGGGSGDLINGDGGADSLYGDAGNDTLDGGTGADYMQGGTGDDTYIVDDAGDGIGELSGEGTDTVFSSISYDITLEVDLENLTLTGTADIDATGNNSANVLTGNSGNNALDGGSSNDTLFGLGGNDTVDGGYGADSMEGGTGDDVYVVDNTNDVIVENAGEGTDMVQASASYTLSANVENLELIGTSTIDGTGNTLDNVITGNSGNNVLDGVSGADTMAGGDGDDTYVVNSLDDVFTENANEGTDTVIINRSHTLGANFERLELTGTADLSGTGNDANNVLRGNSGNNTLDGAGGSDGYYGGDGDDTYIVDSATEAVYENADEGTDTIVAETTFALTYYNHVENLTLAGTGDFNGTGNSEDNVIAGNIGDNDLRGDDGDDTLIGGDGNDTLIGQGGADSMVGGDGGDEYSVDNVGDTITEAANEGYDYVTTSVSFTLSEHIEALYLLTGSSNIDGTGNSGDNYIAGNSGNNRLDGGAGADTLSGRDGDDVYVIDNANDSIEGEYSGNDTVESSISFSLAVISSVENLTLTGTADIDGTGSVLDNVLAGNSGANVLSGNNGADTLTGNGGDDTLSGDAGNDSLEGGDDNDSLSGGTHVDTLVGGAGNDTLDGGSGADDMAGGTGDDRYIVDDVSDAISENSGEGTDTVETSLTTFSLAGNFENLEFTSSANSNGAGNASANVLTGYTGNDTLYGDNGNDTIDGGTGADHMSGGAGDDLFYVDNVGDVVNENALQGDDTVRVSIASYTLTGSTVENVELIGLLDSSVTGSSIANQLTGNSGNNTLAGDSGNDTLDGGEGDDTLDGGAHDDLIDGGVGADSMVGGIGDDTFFVDNVGDVVVEGSGGGTDLVNAAVSFLLGDDLENLTLTGGGNLIGSGNGAANTLIGNTGNNRLFGLAGDDSISGANGNDVIDGGTGSDTMLGGGGNDLFRVDNAGDRVSGGSGRDLVKASVNFALADDVEDLQLLGRASLRGVGNGGNNELTGNRGNNTLLGKSGNDTLNGGGGGDRLDGDRGNDIVKGGGGRDLVLGDIGSDQLYGGNKNDTLKGGAGRDVLMGESGNDWLYGDQGNDVLIGGGGRKDMAFYAGKVGRYDFKQMAHGKVKVIDHTHKLGVDILKSVELVKIGGGIYDIHDLLA